MCVQFFLLFSYVWERYLGVWCVYAPGKYFPFRNNAKQIITRGYGEHKQDFLVFFKETEKTAGVDKVRIFRLHS